MAQKCFDRNPQYHRPHPSFSNRSESAYKELKPRLPEHKSRYAPGKRIALRFSSIADLSEGHRLLEETGIEIKLENTWGERAITRDTAWGIPIPEDKDPEMKGKTFYVWPESLIAPISFTRLALKNEIKIPMNTSSSGALPTQRFINL